MEKIGVSQQLTLPFHQRPYPSSMRKTKNRTPRPIYTRRRRFSHAQLSRLRPADIFSNRDALDQSFRHYIARRLPSSLPVLGNI